MKTRWKFDPYHNAGEFTDGTGSACPPVWVRDQVHGCTGTCRKPDFPGRLPGVGDIALCGHGLPGMILSATQQEVTYPDGKRAMAWVGVHMSHGKLGQPWSSRNPCIIGKVGDMRTDETLDKFVKRQWPEGWPHVVLRRPKPPIRDEDPLGYPGDGIARFD